MEGKTQPVKIKGTSIGTSVCQGHWAWFVEFWNGIQFYMESGSVWFNGLQFSLLLVFEIHCLQPCGAYLR